MVAMMLTYQPFYIGGIDDVERAKRSAYGAMATFLLTFLVAVLYLIMDALKGVANSRRNGGGGGNASMGGMSAGAQRRRSGIDYDGVPTGAEPHVLQANTANLDLPPSVEQAHFT